MGLEWKKAVAITGLLIATSLNAAPQPKGFIKNSTGHKCWFTQSKLRGTYFHQIPGDFAELKFDDATCMTADGLDGEINQMLINQAIGGWHSHPDAKFMARRSELMRTSTLQVRGQCMQSKTYPMAAVALEYTTRNTFYTSVKHAFSLGPCQ